jgi:manganese/zinc/iron transport system substrate-binding protein
MGDLMSRWLFVVVCGFGALLLGCSLKEQEEANTVKKVKVLTTIAMIHDLASYIGQEQIDTCLLITAELDPHSYELVKGDDEKFQEADLVLYNGLHLEHGASLASQLRQHPNALSIGDAIAKRAQDKILVDSGIIDPHVWMDISLWVLGVDPIVDALAALDPESEPLFRERGEDLKKKMLQKHQHITALLHEVSEDKRYLVTSHDAFAYFTRVYLATEEERRDGSWRKRFAAPEGLAPDGQLSALDIQAIINYLIQYKVHVVFPESNVSRDSLKKIVAACKKKDHEVSFSSEDLYGDAMGPSDKTSSYLNMIEQNAITLKSEWSKRS